MPLGKPSKPDDMHFLWLLYETQEHIDGRHVVFIIPKAITQNVCFPYLCTLEAVQMAGVAQLLHCEYK